MLGIVGLGVDDVADGQHAALLGGVRDAEALGIEHVGAASICAKAVSLALGGSNQEPMKRDLELGVRARSPARRP